MFKISSPLPSYILLCLLFVVAQNDVRAQKKLGKKYFGVERYYDALSAWGNVKKIEKDIDLLILRGIAHYHTNKLDGCISDMSTAYSKKAKDNRVFKYTALSYMAKYEYIEASNFFKSYLATLQPKDDDYLWCIHQIKKCGLAKDYQFKKPIAFVENLNIPVNTIYDESKPIISPTNSSRLYFNSNRNSTTGGLRNKKGLLDVKKGTYRYDMYKTEINNGKYDEPSVFLPILNSPNHEKLLGFSIDGKKLFYTQSHYPYNGQLLCEKFSLEKIQEDYKEEIDIPFNSEAGDRDLFWVSDSLFLFSSFNHGGYGGYDLLYCQMVDGQWQKPRNIGPEINSPYNEIAPFLVNSGDVLFFSSDKTETLGGFDIFKSSFSDNKWTSPQSLNYPINSPKDDLDMFISPDGTYGLLSSNRAESKGGHDIYIAYFNEPIYEQREKTNRPLFTQILDNIVQEEVSFVFDDEIIPPIQRDFKSNSLIFQNGETTLEPTHQNILKNLTEILTLYPELNILLVSHTTPGIQNYSDLYFSIKRAEIVINELVKNKISSDRIRAIGCGSEFPISQAILSAPTTRSNVFDDRIEIILSNNIYPGLRIVYDFETITQADKNCNWNDLHKSFNTMIYKKEITQSFIAFDYNSLDIEEPIFTIEKNNNESYSYYYGLFENLETASQSTLEGEIFPFYRGKKIGRNEFEKYSKQFPELENMR